VIDFGDTLEVSVSSSPLHDTLTCDAAGVPLDSSNLVLRAFDLFRRKTGSKQARVLRMWGGYAACAACVRALHAACARFRISARAALLASHARARCRDATASATGATW
jgi:hypothetical protein